MGKYIVNIESGQVFHIDDCLVIDSDNLPPRILEKLTGEPYFDDEIICKAAERYGTTLVSEVL